MRALRAVVEDACASRGWLEGGKTDPALRLGAYDDARWIALLQEVMATEPYRDLGLAPELLRLVRAAVGEPIEAHAGDLVRLVSPGAVDLTTPPHQDGAYLRNTKRAWSAWLPLGACPIELGPLAVLPRSHRDGLLPHGPAGSLKGVEVPEDATWAAADLEEGDVLLFSCMTIHRALPNVTADRLRMSVDYRYRPQSEATRGEPS